MYAIVDIETTGGNAFNNKIIEIAIVVHDGEKVVHEFETLVNPGMPIPRFITGLTGISDDMVKNAPSFDQIASIVHGLLHDKIFVAHNVNFDYSFVKKELEPHNLFLGSKRLCTIRLSRRLIPGKISYSLGKLCKEIGITIQNQHRAVGDARATAQLFSLLIKNDQENFISQSIKKTSRELLLPPNLTRKTFDKLPKTAGVYYFHDAKGKILYVGKARNLKQRVASHFAISSNTRDKQNLINEINYITHKNCGNELIALLQENQDIKELWPKYNLAQKGPRVGYGIYEYLDQNSYLRWAVMRVKKYTKPLKSFSGLDEARNYVWNKIFDFNLCPRLAGLQKVDGKCIEVSDYVCSGACDHNESPEKYNARHYSASESLIEEDSTFVIIGNGRNNYEQSLVLIERGVFKGFGFVKKNVDINNYNLLKSNISAAKENELVKGIIFSYLQKHPETLIVKFEDNHELKRLEIYEDLNYGLFANA